MSLDPYEYNDTHYEITKLGCSFLKGLFHGIWISIMFWWGLVELIRWIVGV